MTIDYKALAERLEGLAAGQDYLADYAFSVEGATVYRRSAVDLRTVVSLLEGMAEQEPVLWMQSDHVDIARRSHFMARCAPTQVQSDYVPLYAHPAPQPQPTAIPAPFMHLLGHAYGLSLGTDWNRGTHAKHYRRPLLDAVSECKRWLDSAPQPQPERQPVSEPTEAQTCLWWRDGDEDSDTWGTSCGNFFALNEGTPTENKIVFCHHCGKRVEDDAALAAKDER